MSAKSWLVKGLAALQTALLFGWMIFAVAVPVTRAVDCGVSCPVGQTCDTTAGTCVAVPTSSCQSNDDCTDAQKCDAQNACVTASCTVTCGAGKACHHGLCTTDASTGSGSCTDDGACGPNEHCSTNVCVAATCTPACATGKLCLHGACVADPSATPSPAAASTTNTKTKSIVAPNLEVKIPGLSFTPALQSQGKLTVNWIGEYVQGVYKYLLGFSVLIAIVMVMIGGLQYVLAAGTGNTKAGKERINNAVIGLILLFSVYLILYTTMGGRLVIFQPLEIDQIKGIDTTPYDTESVVSGKYGGNSTGSATNGVVRGPGSSKVPKDLVAPLQAAADAAVKTDKTIGFYVASSFRSIDDQIRITTEHCQSPVGSNQPCNPRQGQSTACMIKSCAEGSGNFCLPAKDGTYWNAASCPHTTGYALDVWGMDESGRQCVKLENCLGSNVASCRQNPCQAAVIAAMKAQGFCNLQSEPWHFEKPKMSTTCN